MTTDHKCPECNAEIEDIRVTCPKCGYEYTDGDYGDTTAGNQFTAGKLVDEAGNEKLDPETQGQA